LGNHNKPVHNQAHDTGNSAFVETVANPVAESVKKAVGDPLTITTIEASGASPTQFDSCGPGGCKTKETAGAPKMVVDAPKPDVPMVKYAPEGHIRILPPNPNEEEPPLPTTPHVGNLMILFKVENWIPFYIELDPDYTGRVIKNLVQDRTGLGCGFMKLTVVATNRDIENDDLVKNLGLKNGGAVDVISTCAFRIPSNFRSFPPADGINLRMEIPKYDPIDIFADLDFSGSILKNIIMDRTGLAAQDISLFIHNTEILNTTKVMYAGLFDGDTIEVRLCGQHPSAVDKLLTVPVTFPVQVWFQNMNKKISVSVESAYTGRVLKEIVALKAGFPGASLELSFAGQIIDDAEVLSYYPIERNDVIEGKIRNADTPKLNTAFRETEGVAQLWDTEMVGGFTVPESSDPSDHYP